ncbi:hypothetical protein P7K49_000012 [Saguinus oedipus]|uniref:Ras-GAP domain-containing protein n=1 Tax=Saguinus oedipus TaxID=9490 RepID=A0ABQ9WBB2_SAGOE|nr:hypothetical protein P7K49_000012 [Saguinus oedipus]
MGVCRRVLGQGSVPTVFPRPGRQTLSPPPFPRDPNTIFRGNSLASKCIDETMKLAGMHYLHVTLKPAIEEVSAGPRVLSIVGRGEDIPQTESSVQGSSWATVRLECLPPWAHCRDAVSFALTRGYSLVVHLITARTGPVPNACA